MSEIPPNIGKNQHSGIVPDASSVETPRNIPSSRTESGGIGALFGYTLLALGLALLIRFFIAAPYVVSGTSMEPNFDNWDYLITDRISYRFEEPARGDIIVFHLPEQYSRTLIKRIIGLPGETITVNGKGVLIQNTENPDGSYLKEPYLAPENLGGPMGTTVTLGQNDYFVLGDNRRVSSDSRTWGVLPKSDIVGRVFLRLFPLPKLSVLPEEARY